METKYYNRSNNFSAPIKKEPKPYTPAKEVYKEENTVIDEHITCEKKEQKPKEIKSVLSRLKSDDLLLLGLIFLLMSDSDTDVLLLLALGYIFFCTH